MNARALPINDRSATSSALLAIVSGGIAAGVTDLAFAFTFNYVRSGVGLVRILQFIASGLLGSDSFNGGLATAALGACLHFGILIVAAALFYFASRKLTWMTARVWTSGMLYGAAIYLFMNFVVLPLSNIPHGSPALFARACDFAAHVLMNGPALAFMVRRFAPAHAR